MVVIVHSSKKRIKFNFVRFMFSMLFICCCVFGTISAFNGGGTAMSAYEQCETVVVRSGDTLWSVALDLGNNDYDTRTIVKDIMKQNNMSSSEVYVGQTLEIPAKYTVE
ncbi:MAG: LysM peptidoglycan-binding domain-containing protein [Ruminococcaceae bacterium]|nr:LysM peptidoglycan-binding domain-containing protein [Oscillospiraceae bacterium]